MIDYLKIAIIDSITDWQRHQEIFALLIIFMICVIFSVIFTIFKALPLVIPNQKHNFDSGGFLAGVILLVMSLLFSIVTIICNY